jgi:hypothetical protein
MFKNFREFVKTYMNDIIIFFKTLNKHFLHLRSVFKRLSHYNVALNFKKIFLEYSFIFLLNQIVDALNLITVAKNSTIIVNLAFSLTLKKLKIYLNLIDYLRVYVLWYAQTSLSLQKLKILLFKDSFVKSKSRKVFAKKISINQFIEVEQRSYEHLQKMFSKKSFLRHFDLKRKLFIDVDTSKKKDVERMIFHVKRNSNEKIIFRRSDIEFIMFLRKIFTSAKKRYWLTKLKMSEVIWIVRKIRHLIQELRRSFIIIFTDHSALTEIVKQTSLTSANTNKLNLRLIRAFQYLSTLSIEIRMKSERFHVISNVFSRLFFIMNKNNQIELSEKDVLESLKYDLDVMLVQLIRELKTSFFDVRSIYISNYLDVYFEQEECFIEMTNAYRQSLLNAYQTDTQWNRIKEKLKARDNIANTFDDMNFTLRYHLIYYESKNKIRKLCISWSLKKDIYRMTHDDNHHCGFHRVYARIAGSLYIRHMFKRLKRYIQHCRSCLEGQTKRHVSYEELTSIKTTILFFHIVIIDFVVVLPPASIGENAL